MAKKEALRLFHQENIANAADCLFQHNGIDKTTMDDIAQKADYSKATLYVYFKSKEDIFHYIVLKAMNMLFKAVDMAISKSTDAMEQYYAICHAITVYAESHPFYYQSLMKTIAVDTDSRLQNPILEEIYQLGEQINCRIEFVMQSGVKQGYFKTEANLIQTVFLLWAAISSVVQLASNKEAYIHQRMGLTKNQFLECSFRTLLNSITV